MYRSACYSDQLIIRTQVYIYIERNHILMEWCGSKKQEVLKHLAEAPVCFLYTPMHYNDNIRNIYYIIMHIIAM